MAEPINPNPYPGYEASQRCKFCGCFAQYLEVGGNDTFLFRCSNCKKNFPVYKTNLGT